MTSAIAPAPQAPPKSTFVTVIAWIFIVCSGFATFISLLQNVIVAAMPKGLFNQATRQTTQDTTFAQVMPKGAQFVFAHLQVLMLFVLVVCAVTLIASIGLLRRRNWARMTFIGLMGLGILYNVASIFLQRHFLPKMPHFPSSMQGDSTFQQTSARFDQMFQSIRVMTMIFTVGFTALYAWIVVKLSSLSIRREFGA